MRTAGPSCIFLCHVLCIGPTVAFALPARACFELLCSSLQVGFYRGLCLVWGCPNTNLTIGGLMDGRTSNKRKLDSFVAQGLAP